MRQALTKLAPKRGYSAVLHYGLTGLLPLMLVILVRLQSVQDLAFVLVILAKWRMFAVRPRFWATNIRANAVDIMVGLSVVVFMMHAGNAGLQLLWALIYGGWLLMIKPRSGTLWTAIQAAVGQFTALMALYLAGPSAPLLSLTFAAGLICYLAARHFFDGFDEAYARLLSYAWGYSAAALAWLTSHWLLFYGFIAQPTLLLTVIGYVLAAIYYLDHKGRLTATLQRQLIFALLAAVILVITLSDWGDKAI